MTKINLTIKKSRIIESPTKIFKQEVALIENGDYIYKTSDFLSNIGVRDGLSIFDILSHKRFNSLSKNVVTIRGIHYLSKEDTLMFFRIYQTNNFSNYHFESLIKWMIEDVISTTFDVNSKMINTANKQNSNSVLEQIRQLAEQRLEFRRKIESMESKLNNINVNINKLWEQYSKLTGAYL